MWIHLTPNRLTSDQLNLLNDRIHYKKKLKSDEKFRLHSLTLSEKLFLLNTTDYGKWTPAPCCFNSTQYRCSTPVPLQASQLQSTVLVKKACFGSVVNWR